MFIIGLHAFFTVLYMYLSQLFACSYIIGSWHGYFSLSNISIPAFMAHFNIVYALFYYFTKAFFAKNAFLFCLKKMSFLFSGLSYKNKDNFLFSVILPLACMALFIVHPIGNIVFWYSFFWLIPMSLYFVSKKNIYMHGLVAAFVSHAVGSVVWLYVYNLDASAFMLAAPFVLFERAVFALGIVSIDKMISFVKQVTIKFVPSFQKA